MREPLLEVRSLTKEYRTPTVDIRAVDDVSFSLRIGESLGVVGESGSGKSTTARMIVGLEPASSGAVFLRNERIRPRRRASARRAQAKRVQMVFQDPFASLDPRQTLGDCLREVIAVHGTPNGESVSAYEAALLSRVGLDAGYAQAFPRALSGGQRQRFSIARALAPNPELLILDEAVSALDVSVQAQILNLLASLRTQSEVALLFISHDLAVIRQVCERIVVMRHGQIVEQGQADSVLDAPRHPYTRQLIDAVPGPGWVPPARKRDRAGGYAARG